MGGSREASGPSSPSAPEVACPRPLPRSPGGLTPPLLGPAPPQASAPAPAGAGRVPGSGLQAGRADPSLAPLRPADLDGQSTRTPKRKWCQDREGKVGGRGSPFSLIRLFRAWGSPVRATTSLPGAAHPHPLPTAQPGPGYPVLLAVTWANTSAPGTCSCSLKPEEAARAVRGESHTIRTQLVRLILGFSQLDRGPLVFIRPENAH